MTTIAILDQNLSIHEDIKKYFSHLEDIVFISLPDPYNCESAIEELLPEVIVMDQAYFPGKDLYQCMSALNVKSPRSIFFILVSSILAIPDDYPEDIHYFRGFLQKGFDHSLLEKNLHEWRKDHEKWTHFGDNQGKPKEVQLPNTPDPEDVKDTINQVVKRFAKSDLEKFLWEILPPMAENILNEEIKKLRDQTMSSNN